MKVGMEFYIDYAHLLEGHEVCGQPHGHTAKIIVEVIAKEKVIPKFRQYDRIVSFQDAMLIDFKDLKRQVTRVLNQIDHKDLNTMFRFPSSEVITNWLWDQFVDVINTEEYCIHLVRFYEGNGKYVEIIGATLDWYSTSYHVKKEAN